MTTHTRIAAFLSTSALCLGLVAAPSTFAASADARPQAQRKNDKSDKLSVKQGAETLGAVKTPRPDAVMAPAK